MLPTERSAKMIDLKPYYQVKLTLLRFKDLLSPQSPENRGRKIRLWYHSKGVPDKWEKYRNVGLGEKQATFQ